MYHSFLTSGGRKFPHDFGTAYGLFLLVGETTVSRQPFDRYTFIL